MPDWNEIKTQYISTNKTVKELAKEYGVNLRTLYRRIEIGGWKHLKLRNAQKLTEKAVSKLGAQELEKLSKLMGAAADAVDVAAMAMADVKQFNRYLVTECDETQEKIFSKYDTKSLRDMIGVLKDLTGMMREFYDLPTPAQTEQRRIALEKLEILKRAALPEADRTLTVRFEDTEGAEK